MRFENLKYERPNVEEVKETYRVCLEKIRAAGSAEAQIEAIDELQKLRNTLYSMRDMIHIFYFSDTLSEFNAQEDAFWGTFNPVWNTLDTEFYKAMKESPYLDKLKEKYSQQLFNIIDHFEAVFDESILEDMQEDNKLISESIRFSAGNVMIDGKEEAYPTAIAMMSSLDRAERKKGFDAFEQFYVEREAEFDRIFHEMVQVRKKEAKKLGFKSYVDMSLRIRQRVGYTLEDIRAFREAVKKYIVPINAQIREEQRKRLGLDQLMYYDEDILFEDMAMPKYHSEEELCALSKKAMANLGDLAHEYWNYLESNHYLDLYARPGKALGGIAYYVPDYKAPVILTNFKGTPYDVEVLSHELGHAFQLYQSGHMPSMELFYPTSDSCEVHSMAMEFFFWKNYDIYFDGDTTKNKYTHLTRCLQTLAWCCLIDEFQDEVYSGEDLGPEDYKEIWKRLDKVYFPYRCYGENSHFNKGTFWHKQLHVFQTPFYYVDYAFAQMCALQFWRQILKNPDEAWENYLNICKVGGFYPFLEMIERGKVKSPFNEELIAEMGSFAKDYLDHMLDEEK